jgi:hypothetical protein
MTLFDVSKLFWFNSSYLKNNYALIYLGTTNYFRFFSCLSSGQISTDTHSKTNMVCDLRNRYHKVYIEYVTLWLPQWFPVPQRHEIANNYQLCSFTWQKEDVQSFEKTEKVGETI